MPADLDLFILRRQPACINQATLDEGWREIDHIQAFKSKSQPIEKLELKTNQFLECGIEIEQ